MHRLLKVPVRCDWAIYRQSCPCYSSSYTRRLSLCPLPIILLRSPGAVTHNELELHSERSRVLYGISAEGSVRSYYQRMFGWVTASLISYALSQRMSPSRRARWSAPMFHLLRFFIQRVSGAWQEFTVYKYPPGSKSVDRTSIATDNVFFMLPAE